MYVWWKGEGWKWEGVLHICFFYQWMRLGWKLKVKKWERGRWREREGERIVWKVFFNNGVMRVKAFLIVFFLQNLSWINVSVLLALPFAFFRECCVSCQSSQTVLWVAYDFLSEIFCLGFLGVLNFWKKFFSTGVSNLWRVCKKSVSDVTKTK